MSEQEKLDTTETENNGNAEIPAEEAVSASPEEIAKAEAAEWRDKYIRKLAEFDNFRKRTRQESEMLGQLVAESLISTLLPIMDDINRTLANLPADDSPYRKGIELIRGKLWSFFESRDVKMMEVRGKPFDPNQHDALMMRATSDFPAGTVLDVITPGYMIGERVIRHAQVIVSEESSETESQSEPENN